MTSKQFHDYTRSNPQWKILSLHSVNKAFERYFSMESDDLRSLYRDTGNVINLDKSMVKKT